MQFCWSSTIQDRRSVLIIPLPNLGQSILCPIGALQAMTHVFPASSHDPNFLIPKNNGLVPLTDSVARKHLKKASLALKYFTSTDFSCFQEGRCLLGFFPWSSPRAYYETWYLAFILYPFLYISCCCSFSSCPTLLILLGFGEFLPLEIKIIQTYILNIFPSFLVINWVYFHVTSYSSTSRFTISQC